MLDDIISEFACSARSFFAQSSAGTLTVTVEQCDLVHRVVPCVNSVLITVMVAPACDLNFVVGNGRKCSGCGDNATERELFGRRI